MEKVIFSLKFNSPKEQKFYEKKLIEHGFTMICHETWEKDEKNNPNENKSWSIFETNSGDCINLLVLESISHEWNEIEIKEFEEQRLLKDLGQCETVWEKE